MNWKLLNIDDLRQILSEKETQELDSMSLNSDITSVIDQTILMIADMWRGALSAKGYTLDKRPHYIPSTYVYYVLVHARHAIWTRFPHSESIALDDRREEEYEEAKKLLENPFIDVPTIDEEEGLTGDEQVTGTGAGSIRVPYQRFTSWPMYSTTSSLDLTNYL